MTGEHEDQAVAVARIEATLLAIKNQIDYSERSSAQLVRLVDERFTARFDAMDKRLGEMDASGQRARDEDLRFRRDLEARITAVERRVPDKAEERLTALERFNVKLVGIVIGASLGSAGLTGVVIKAIT